MSTQLQCPICLDKDNSFCESLHTTKDTKGYSCSTCGDYEISRTVLADGLKVSGHELSAMMRAILVHQLSKSSRSSELPMVTSYWLESLNQNARLPSPKLQATNLIRFVGDHVSTTGESCFLESGLYAKIGSFSPSTMHQLALQLSEKGILRNSGSGQYTAPGGKAIISTGVYDLSLDGWEVYEGEKRGKSSANYGFMAMQFAHHELDPFVKKVIKPAVREFLKFDLVDMRDVAQTGIIDNLMREQIRNAAFVIADLSHENAGAYWEAGYAEGLGKPVLYICENEKFQASKTHFDTNHSTTIPWKTSEPELFQKELIATLKRSLNMLN